MEYKKMRWFGIRRPIREQSKPYRFVKTNMTDGEMWSQNLDIKPYNKYLPFNYMQISNNGDQNIVLVAGELTKTIYAGTIISIDEETIKAYRDFVVTNSSGSALTGEIEIICQKVVTQEMIAKRQAGYGV